MRRTADVLGAVEAMILAVSAVVGVYLLIDGHHSDAFGIVGIWLFLAVTSAVGWLLASRIPRNPLGWLLLTVSGLFLIAAVAFVLGKATVDAYPGLATWMFWYAGDQEVTWSWLPPVGLLFTQVLLRFPDGELTSPRWRWFSRFTLVSLVGCTVLLATTPGQVGVGIDNPVGWTWGEQHAAVVVPVMASALLVSFVGSAISVVVRYRRGSTLTRAQIRWVAWAGSIVIGFYICSFLVPGEVLNSWVVLAYTLIPASIGVAVLRYHLYDIDRVLSRTTTYLIVTGLMLATYAVAAAVISLPLDNGSPLTVAAATLAAAGIARPVLTRVQAKLDRRFNRSSYDARHTVDEFGTRLRSQVDPPHIREDLVTIVNTTLEPTRVTLWIRQPS
ncbi:MAG: hypothetical protein ACJ74E_03095 [Actinomycetes bacterium]